MLIFGARRGGDEISYLSAAIGAVKTPLAIFSLAAARCFYDFFTVLRFRRPADGKPTTFRPGSAAILAALRAALRAQQAAPLQR